MCRIIAKNSVVVLLHLNDQLTALAHAVVVEKKKNPVPLVKKGTGLLSYLMLGSVNDLPLLLWHLRRCFVSLKCLLPKWQTKLSKQNKPLLRCKIDEFR